MKFMERPKPEWPTVRRTAFLLALFCVVSCSDDDPTSKWRVFADERSDGKDEAEVAGVLRYATDDRCFTLEDNLGSGDQAFAIVWPAGTEGLAGERAGVRVPGVGEVLAGEVLEGGGGYYTLEEGDEPATGLSGCVAVGEEYVSVDTISSHSS